MFNSNRWGVNIPNEFLLCFFYSITDDYDSLENNYKELVEYLNSLSVKRDGCWRIVDYKRFGFTSKDCSIKVNYSLGKVLINGIEIRPGFFKDVLDYFYLVKLIFTVENVAEIYSPNRDDVYLVRVFDRLFLPNFKVKYACNVNNSKVNVYSIVELNIFDIFDFLDSYHNDDNNCLDFYTRVFDSICSEMKTSNYSTFYRGICLSYLYEECSSKGFTLDLSKYENSIMLASAYNKDC